MDVFSELNQTVNGRFYARDVKIFSKTLKSSRDDFNVLENFNVSSIKTANKSLGCWNLENIWIMHKTPTLSLWVCG